MKNSYHPKKILQLQVKAILFLFLTIIMSSAVPVMAQEVGVTGSNTSCDCQQAVKLLKKQKKTFNHEFRRIKRELGAMKVSLNKPGFTQILGGIGYIIGLFGLSYYWYARNLLKERP